jgi:AcrR family transcriptional regulator
LANAESAELRADAARNRDALLEAATRTFSASATEPSMRAIAREAGVGIATLYRHFPTRESLVDAVYHDQVQRLTQGADELLRQGPPVEALRAWMDLFGDWLSTKHGMIDTLRTMIDSGEIAQTETRDELLAAITRILDSGSAAGDLRSDVAAEDIAASIIGTFTVSSGRREQAGRLLDLLVDGLRTRNDGPPTTPGPYPRTGSDEAGAQR